MGVLQFLNLLPLSLCQVLLSLCVIASRVPGTYLLLELQHCLLHLVELLARGAAGALSHRVLGLLIVP